MIPAIASTSEINIIKHVSAGAYYVWGRVWRNLGKEGVQEKNRRCLAPPPPPRLIAVRDSTFSSSRRRAFSAGGR